MALFDICGINPQSVFKKYEDDEEFSTKANIGQQWENPGQLSLPSLTQVIFIFTSMKNRTCPGLVVIKYSLLFTCFR